MEFIYLIPIISQIPDPASRKRDFSGLYEPLPKETFAGAYLLSIERFLAPSSIRVLKATQINQIENVIFAETNYGNPLNLMSRDYFDFQVIHLSSTTNQIPEHIFNNPAFQRELISRMTNTVASLKTHAEIVSSAMHKPILVKDTLLKGIQDAAIAVVPYTSYPGSQEIDPNIQANTKFNEEIRLLFLQATIYSISRYFPRIVVTFADKEDMNRVMKLGLPVWKYLDLSRNLHHRTMLPSRSMLYVHQMLTNQTARLAGDHDEWNSVKYIYYSEMDQILCARFLPEIIQVIDNIKPSVTLIPHRMQVSQQH